jgi:Sec-independent protein translocase protein TatA
MPGCLKQQTFKFEKIIMKQIKIYVIIILISCVLFFCLADCQFNPSAKIPKKKVTSSVGNGNGDKNKAGSGITNTVTNKRNDGSTGGEAIVSLMINSNPMNASVFIDTKFSGYTPYKIPSISCGPHTFIFTKDGYKDKPFVYVLSENTKPLNISLELAQSGETTHEKLATADVLNKSNESASIDPFHAESSNKAANATKPSNSSETSWPPLSAQWILILIGVLSLLIGPGLLRELYKYIRKMKQEQKKKSDDSKALLSANLEEQKEGCAIIKVTNVGVAIARNYCILFSGKTSTGEHYNIKTLDHTGFSIPAQHSIPIEIKCNNWIEICVKMRWDDDSGSDHINNMCFLLTPI